MDCDPTENNTNNDNGVSTSSGDDSTLGLISMDDFIKTVEPIRSSVVEEEEPFPLLAANQQQDQEQQEQNDDRENNPD